MLRTCDAVAFRSIINKITIGVAKEIQYAQEHKMPIIELPTLTSDRFLTMEETGTYFRPAIKK